MKRLFLYCKVCKKQISKRYRSGFCSDTCRRSKPTPVLRPIVSTCTVCGKGLTTPSARACVGICASIARRRAYIERWKQGLEDGMRAPGIVSNHVRHYLFVTRGERCEECQWRRRHPVTKHVPLEIHHIDGDSFNTVETNLKLLCPNCHALTPNHRALNMGRGRPQRRKQKAA